MKDSMSLAGCQIIPIDLNFHLKNVLDNFEKKNINSLNPNWHEAGRIYPPYNFLILILSGDFYQKFPNILGGKN